MALPLPRNVIAKRLANGKLGFYFNVQSIYRKLGCPVPNEALGSDYQIACGSDGNGGRGAKVPPSAMRSHRHPDGSFQSLRQPGKLDSQQPDHVTREPRFCCSGSFVARGEAGNCSTVASDGTTHPLRPNGRN